MWTYQVAKEARFKDRIDYEFQHSPWSWLKSIWNTSFLLVIFVFCNEEHSARNYWEILCCQPPAMLCNLALTASLRASSPFGNCQNCYLTSKTNSWQRKRNIQLNYLRLFILNRLKFGQRILSCSKYKQLYLCPTLP